MSFATQMTTDKGTTERPTWRDVEDAINALDAEATTIVTLAPAAPKGPPPGDHHMAIGGGKDGRCIVYVTEDNLQFWNLEDVQKHSSRTRIVMLIGGQEGEYRDAQCVPKEWALKAGRSYYESGVRNPDLPWTRG